MRSACIASGLGGGRVVTARKRGVSRRGGEELTEASLERALEEMRRMVKGRGELLWLRPTKLVLNMVGLRGVFRGRNDAWIVDHCRREAYRAEKRLSIGKTGSRTRKRRRGGVGT